MTRTGRHREPASAARTSFVVGAATLAVLAAILATLVFSRGPATVASATPGPDPAAVTASNPPDAPAGEAAQTAPASPVAAPLDILPPGATARVVADALRIRMAPSTTSDAVATVAEGDIVYTAAGVGGTQARVPPYSAEGYDWYYVHHVPGVSDWPLLEGHEAEVIGWMAAGSDAERYVELVPPECPADPQLADLVALTPYERVACLGDRTITLQGTYGCPYCDSLAYPGTFEPSWLALYLLEMNLLTPGWAAYPPFPGAVTVVTAPDVPPFSPEARGSVLRVTGHFSDARSSECVMAPGEPGAEDASHDEAAEWYCRERFVVESWEVVGDDPGWAAAASDG